MSGATVAIAVAGLIALAAWAPIWQDGIGSKTADRSAAEPTPVAELPPAPGSAWDWWYGGPGSESNIPAVSRSAAFPGPYSPLVIQPPITGAAARSAALSYGE